MNRTTWISWITLSTPMLIYIVIANEDIPRIIWTSSNYRARTSDIYSVPVLRTKSPTKKREIKKVTSLKYPHFLSSIVSNDARQELIAVDTGRGNIASFNTKSERISGHLGGVSSRVSGISVDWSNGNIYWADDGRRWIAAAKWNLMKIALIVTNIINLKGVAAYPQKGALFWSDQQSGNKRAEIWRSTLSGLRKSKIHDCSGPIVALSIEPNQGRLYWIEGNGNTVWYIDVDSGSESAMLYTGKNHHFTGIAAYEGLVFVSDTSEGEIISISDETKMIVDTIKAEKPLGIAISGGRFQEIFSGPCDIKNGGCQEFCFPQPPGNLRKCGCSTGLTLSSDGIGCESNLIRENFFLLADSDLRVIFQISASGSRYNRLVIPEIGVPVQVEFDDETKTVYWTDVGTRSVNSAKWDGSSFRVLASKNVQQPTGLGTINVIKSDGTHRKTLLTNDLKTPRSIVVDHQRGLMWWTDWTKKTIEMAYMDGSKRKVIVNTEIDWPNDGRLYWVDAHVDVVYSSNLKGKDRREYKKLNDSAHMFGIAVSKDYIYWTDWNQPSVMRIRKNDDKLVPEPFGPKIFSKICDIHHVAATKTISQSGNHPCRKHQSNCSQLCIPIPNQLQSSDITVDTTSNQLRGSCACDDNNDSGCKKPVKVVDIVKTTKKAACPENMVLLAPPCQMSVMVSETSQSMTRKKHLASKKVPENRFVVRLSEGKHKRKIQVTGLTGKSESCHIYITVKVERCIDIYRHLELFENVQMLYSTCGNRHGSIVKVYCPNEMKLTGSDHLFCNVNGQWIGQPSCMHTRTSAKFARTPGMEITYLVVPSAVVVFILISSGVVYRYCKGRGLTVPNVGEDCDYQMMGKRNGAIEMQDTVRSQRSFTRAMGTSFAQVEENILNSASAGLPTISTITVGGNSTMDSQAIYAEPAAEETDSSAATHTRQLSSNYQLHT